MTRLHVCVRSFPLLGALVALGAIVACGPRLKPVEYEEPKSSSGSDEEPTGGDESSSSSSSASSEASSSSSESSEGGDEGASKAWSPCSNRRCGAPCTECRPSDENCMEVLVMKQCDSEGSCVPAPAECKSKDEKGKGKGKNKDKDKAP